MAEKDKALAPISSSDKAETLIAQAISQGVPVETMERLLAMRKELKQEAAQEAFNAAMAAFQAAVPIIKKTKKVMDKFGKPRYSYAPLDSIVIQVRKPLKENGLSYTLDALVEEGWVSAFCKITHSQGHSEVSTFKIPVDKDSYMSAPQKFASAMTFAKRYAFCNALGILTGDEDTDATNTDNEAEEGRFNRLMDEIGKSEKGTLLKYKNSLIESKKYSEPHKKILIAAIDKILNAK